MSRLIPAAAGVAALLCGAAARAGIIDSFETGGFSHSLSAPATTSYTQDPNTAHCISDERIVRLTYWPGSTGTVSADLVPLDGQDDAVEVSFTNGLSGVRFQYEGGPWDLTEGGLQNRITVKVRDAQPGSTIQVSLEDSAISHVRTLQISGAGNYHIPFSDFTLIDPTAVERIRVDWWGEDGETGALREIRTTNGPEATLIYGAWEPLVLTYLCAASPRSGGENVLGWDWTPGWPSAPSLAGPILHVTRVSAPGCVNVAFTAAPSASQAGPGPMGLVAVDWQAATFSGASFELEFTTDPTAPYTAHMNGEPVVTEYPDALSVAYEIAISGAPGIPDGIVRQELIVSIHPDQGAAFAYAEALPTGGAGAGMALQFALTGGSFVPSSPLLELFTTASYVDHMGATGVASPAAAAAGGPALTAHPGVTRSDVRFVLPAGSPEGAAVHVFDVTGRRVRTLASAAGEAHWDGTGPTGLRAPAGVYFGRTPAAVGAARVVLLR